MTEMRLVRINCPDLDTAKRVAQTLIEDRLIACANISAPVTSIYRWGGQVQSETEYVVFAKTTAARFGALCDRVRDLHPHDVPAILSIPVEASEDFGNWVVSETLD